MALFEEKQKTENILENNEIYNNKSKFKILKGLIKKLFLIISQVIFNIFFILLLSYFSNYFSKHYFNKSNHEVTSSFVYDVSENDRNPKWLDLVFNSKIRKQLEEIIYVEDLLRCFVKDKVKKNKKKIDNIIMYGPPGTGKSYLAQLIAKNISKHYIIVPAGSLQKIYVGSGASNWSSIVNKAKKVLDSYPDDKEIIFSIIVEEIDSLAGLKDRGFGFGSVDDTLINTFLESVDSLNRENTNIVIIGTTNNISWIEGAAKRPGRFENIFIGHSNDKDSIRKMVYAVKSKLEEEYFISDKEEKDNYILIEEDYWNCLAETIFEKVEEFNKFANEIGTSNIEVESFRRNNKNKISFIFPEVYSAVKKNILWCLKAQTKKENSSEKFFIKSTEAKSLVNFIIQNQEQQ